MSVSSVLFIMACAAMYRLGAYNQRNPGQLWAFAKFLWKWMQT
jgi:hypothetical protein